MTDSTVIPSNMNHKWCSIQTKTATLNNDNNESGHHSIGIPLELLNPSHSPIRYFGIQLFYLQYCTHPTMNRYRIFHVEDSIFYPLQRGLWSYCGCRTCPVLLFLCGHALGLIAFYGISTVTTIGPIQSWEEVTVTCIGHEEVPIILRI
jgi:hypothetical protein